MFGIRARPTKPPRQLCSSSASGHCSQATARNRDRAAAATIQVAREPISGGTLRLASVALVAGRPAVRRVEVLHPHPVRRRKRSAAATGAEWSRCGAGLAITEVLAAEIIDHAAINKNGLQLRTAMIPANHEARLMRWVLLPRHLGTRLLNWLSADNRLITAQGGIYRLRSGVRPGLQSGTRAVLTFPASPDCTRHHGTSMPSVSPGPGH